MKRTLLLLPALMALTLGGTARGAVQTFSFTGLNLAIPDGNPSGLANTQPITSVVTVVQSLEVNVSLSGTYNGDLYAYLTYSGSGGLSVLLNRPGRTSGNAFGYGDDGISVVLLDGASLDIHNYRNTTTPTPGNPITGTWQPDGRSMDPNLVTDLSPRNAMLSSLNGGNATGNWTLFVADLSTGETHTLQSWGLTITGIPEPGSYQLGGTALMLLSLRRRRAVRTSS